MYYLQKQIPPIFRRKEWEIRGRLTELWQQQDSRLPERQKRKNLGVSGGSEYLYVTSLRPEIAPVKAPMLTLVMAYAAAMALRECTGLDVQIKWPNDLVINGKKSAES